ncbi:unnamed protein product [Caenorhabditis angaria]|uniref:Uncharacterized protein n=1 Tax=Caenorhabditis angaria TaxID=860376 RepID=A0A9P1IJQ1_9PELO|nr:unnamed protein product [Caenorhabditis angaria]
MRIKFHIIFSLALFLTKFECSFADEISRKFYKTWISAVENENSDRIRELIGAKFETNLEKDKLLEKLVQKYKSIKFKEDENAIFTMDLKYFDGSEVKLKGENVGGKIEIRKIVGDAVKNDGFLKFERDFDKAIKGKNRKILEFLIIGPNGGQKALFINWLISQKSLKITRIRSDRRKYRIKSGPTFFIIFVEKVEQFYKNHKN